MTDRTTKILLVIIALGLWANVAMSFMTLRNLAGVQFYMGLMQSETSSALTSVQVDADMTRKDVSGMALDVSNIATGKCTNDRICP